MFWIAVAASYSFFIVLNVRMMPIFIFVLLVLIMLLLVGLAICKKTFLSLVVLFVLTGLLVSCSGAGRYLSTSESALTEEARWYTFTILEDPLLTSYGSSYCAKTTLLTGETVKVRLYFDSKTDLAYGDTIVSETKLKAPSENLMEGFQRKGIVARTTVETYEHTPSSLSFFDVIAQARRNAIALFHDCPLDSDAMLLALLTGERSLLYMSDLYQDVKVCGLAHLVAVSGAHLVIVAAFVAFLLDRTPLSKRIKTVIQIVMLVSYLFLLGFRFPVCGQPL